MEYGAKLASVYAHDSSGELLGNRHGYTSHPQQHVVVQTATEHRHVSMETYEHCTRKCFVLSILYSGCHNIVLCCVSVLACVGRGMLVQFYVVL